MAKLNETVEPTPGISAPNGVYVRGVVVSNRAKAFKRKDGTGISVAVECEILDYHRLIRFIQNGCAHGVPSLWSR